MHFNGSSAFCGGLGPVAVNKVSALNYYTQVMLLHAQGDNNQIKTFKQTLGFLEWAPLSCPLALRQEALHNIYSYSVVI